MKISEIILEAVDPKDYTRYVQGLVSTNAKINIAAVGLGASMFATGNFAPDEAYDNAVRKIEAGEVSDMDSHKAKGDQVYQSALNSMTIKRSTDTNIGTQPNNSLRTDTIGRELRAPRYYRGKYSGKSLSDLGRSITDRLPNLKTGATAATSGWELGKDLARSRK